MVKLIDVWPEQDVDLNQFAELLGISRATVSRIMAAERKNERYLVSTRIAMRLARKLCKILDQDIALEDLEGVTLAPPRPGRPKKAGE